MRQKMNDTKRKEKKDEIIKNAYKLFETCNFFEVKMIDIANISKVAKGTLFNYFETKETLFSEMLYNEYYNWGSNEILKINSHKSFNKGEYYDFIINGTLDIIDNRLNLIKLAAVKRSIINQNIKKETIISNSEELNKLIRNISDTTIKKIDFLDHNQVYKLYIAIHIILIGTYNLGTDSDSVNDYLKSESLQSIIDMKKNVTVLLESYLQNLLKI